MSTALSLLALLAFLFGPTSQAQTEPPPFAPGARPSGPQQPVQQFRVEDGGTREVLESIVIPPKASAPFSLLLQTEWVKTLPDACKSSVYPVSVLSGYRLNNIPRWISWATSGSS